MTFYNLPDTAAKIDFTLKPDPEDKRVRKLVIDKLPESGYTVVEEADHLTIHWKE